MYILIKNVYTYLYMYIFYTSIYIYIHIYVYIRGKKSLRSLFTVPYCSSDSVDVRVSDGKGKENNTDDVSRHQLGRKAAWEVKAIMLDMAAGRKTSSGTAETHFDSRVHDGR